jgi:hypothetical protein
VLDVEARSGQLSGGLRASAAYLLTGSLAGVNAAIPGYPIFAAQALRYTLATIVLAAACWAQRRRHPLDGPKIRLTRRVVVLLGLQATVGVTGPADVAGAVLVAAGVALPIFGPISGPISGGAGARPTGQEKTGQRKEEDTAAAPQQSRTRTGAPRA